MTKIIKKIVGKRKVHKNKDGSITIKGSEPYSMDANDITKAVLGLIGAAIAAALVYFQENLDSFNLGPASVIVAAAIPFMLDLVRRFLQDQSEEGEED